MPEIPENFPPIAGSRLRDLCALGLSEVDALAILFGAITNVSPAALPAVLKNLSREACRRWHTHSMLTGAALAFFRSARLPLWSTWGTPCSASQHVTIHPSSPARLETTCRLIYLDVTPEQHVEIRSMLTKNKLVITAPHLLFQDNDSLTAYVEAEIAALLPVQAADAPRALEPLLVSVFDRLRAASRQSTPGEPAAQSEA